jgi:hypothetical protein
MDYHVTAWNFVDEQGSPLIEIDEDMTREEYRDRVEGRFACISCGLLRPITREIIDRALTDER